VIDVTVTPADSDTSEVIDAEIVEQDDKSAK
jgi:hypothetical protein